MDPSPGVKSEPTVMPYRYGLLLKLSSDGGCDPVLVSIDANITIDTAAKGTVVIYTCSTGYLFSDALINQSITCLGAPINWIPPMDTTCWGKSESSQINK